MSRILVVQTAFLGDIVLTTPLLRELRRARPAFALDVLTTPTGRDLLGGLGLDRLLVHDKRGDARGVAALLGLARRLRAERYEIVVAAHRSWRTAFLVALTGAPLRIGFTGSASGRACSTTVPWAPDRHAVERYLELAGPAGGGTAGADAKPALSVDPAAAARIASRLGGVAAGAPFVAIAPGSVWGAKRWTVAGFADTVRAVSYEGLVPVLVGSRSERTRCEEVDRAAGGSAINLAGETTIPDLVAVLAAAEVLVANDSGPAHVAAAVGTPTVTVFGPTVPSMGYAPFGEHNRTVGIEGLDCRPCHRHGPATCPLGHHRCMSELASSVVVDALRDVLQTARAG